MSSSSLNAAIVALLLAATASPTAATDGYVGAAVCGSCHEAELKLWRGSDHDLAMQEATTKTVLGNFAATTFTARGVQSTFSTTDGRFSVRTEGSDGKESNYPVAYTFGVDPLQQYLIAFPNGAYQALTTAWDTRPKKAGGQRWFDLYPNEKTPPGDVLHWTGPGNNWNRMCADCHSTNLRTKYTLADKRYETTRSEINVACEACHGPGERHTQWAKAAAAGGTPPGYANRGLGANLSGSRSGSWLMQSDSGIARLSEPRAARAEIETCAPCHSRRSKIADYDPGTAFLDAYRPALLDEGLYFADGQMQEEVYVWGSFIQSRMFHAGVTCGDCHDPHSLRLRAEGNAMCASCHASAKFDTTLHHHHARASRGALCVECHMPSRTYMIVDPRHDHSFRVPRPDLTITTGAPNTCNTCHQNQTAEWARNAIKSWKGAEPKPHFATAIAAGRRLGPDAGKDLTALIGDRTKPAIARATALGLLPGFAIEDTVVAVQGTVSDEDALVRAAAAEAAGRLPPQMRPALIHDLLDDRVRLVRLEAVRALAPNRSQLTGKPAEQFDRTLAEYEAAQALNADQPQAHVNLAGLYAELGRTDDAEREYKAAIEVGAYFIPAYVNLADLYRTRGRDDEAEATLRKALERADDDGLYHSLGLTLVRLGRTQEALAALRRAYELGPSVPRNGYVYGVALNSLGQHEEALMVLEKAHQAHPADTDITVALATMQRDAGNTAAALKYAQENAVEWPNSQAAKELVESLTAKP